MIDSRLLRAFNAVAEELHFGRAAQRLNMSQPPLSLSIRQLEELLDAPLFVRTTRQVQLTAAGVELLQRLPAIKAAHQEAVEAVRHLSLGMRGALSVALTPSAAFTPIPPVLSRFRHQFPLVHLQFREMNSRDMGQALLSGSVDLAIARPFALSESLTSELIYREQMYLSVPRDDALSSQETISLQEALSTPLIGYHPRESHYFHMLLERLRSLVPGTGTPRFQSMVPTILLLVESGMGSAIVAQSLTRLRGDTLKHILITGTEPIRAELVAVHSATNSSSVLKRFLAILRSELHDSM